MGQSEDLLRLLEPAVRPGNLPATARAGQPPIEQRSFEALLQEAQQGEPASLRESVTTSAPAESARHPNTGAIFTQLAGVDRIENASLRTLVGGPTRDNEAGNQFASRAR